jgi:hypothetical protein
MAILTLLLLAGMIVATDHRMTTAEQDAGQPPPHGNDPTVEMSAPG